MTVTDGTRKWDVKDPYRRNPNRNSLPSWTLKAVKVASGIGLATAGIAETLVIARLHGVPTFDRRAKIAKSTDMTQNGSTLIGAIRKGTMSVGMIDGKPGGEAGAGLARGARTGGVTAIVMIGEIGQGIVGEAEAGVAIGVRS